MPENKTRSLLPVLGKAPELAGIKGWINSEPLKIEELKGKVVLIDFWTYSCINCIRTLPYLKAWHEKYKDQGLVIIGVHTPEFEFEKDYTNVKSAVEKYGIKYAVAQDNDYATWRAYKNSYWPRKYLIDKDGNIRYDHIGEGGYEETEKAIMELLQETNTAMQANKNLTYISSDTELSRIGTPELYLGYDFARAPLGNPEGFSPESIVNYKETNITAPNIIYLSGSWKNERDKIIAVNNSRLFLVYKAKDVNIVAGGAGVVEIFIDSVPAGVAVIDSQRLYNIISAPDYSPHLLEIRANPGFEIYTFTFG
ncbi:MAG: thioredoxin family protein [Candidatus Aenigmarchaeota archaeon]|nr:thioredoxin family protein [Candidatus Aenigmarchaeota archaeon]